MYEYNGEYIYNRIYGEQQIYNSENATTDANECTLQCIAPWRALLQYAILLYVYALFVHPFTPHTTFAAVELSASSTSPAFWRVTLNSKYTHLIA